MQKVDVVTKLVVLYHHWSSLIWHEEEGFPSNVGLSKPKMTTSVTLGLGKNCPHSWYYWGKKSIGPKLEVIIAYHIRFIVKLLEKCCGYSIILIFVEPKFL